MRTKSKLTESEEGLDKLLIKLKERLKQIRDFLEVENFRLSYLKKLCPKIQQPFAELSDPDQVVLYLLIALEEFCEDPLELEELEKLKEDKWLSWPKKFINLDEADQVFIRQIIEKEVKSIEKRLVRTEEELSVLIQAINEFRDKLFEILER